MTNDEMTNDQRNHSVLTEVTFPGPQAFGRPSPTRSIRCAP